MSNRPTPALAVTLNSGQEFLIRGVMYTVYTGFRARARETGPLALTLCAVCSALASAPAWILHVAPDVAPAAFMEV